MDPGGAGFEAETRCPLRGVIGRVLEARVNHQLELESGLSESPESWTGDTDGAWSKPVRWALSGLRKCRFFQTLWLGDHADPSISGEGVVA